MDPPVNEALFRGVMGRFATGVTVVTAHHGHEDAGMTVNAFLSVSLDPPSVVVALSRTADSTPLVTASGRFAVNLLGADQKDLSDRFAARIPSAEKFAGVATHRGTTGPLLLDGHTGALECQVEQSLPFATHILFVARVLRLETGREGAPLIFWGSHYGEARGEGDLHLPPPRPLGPR